jgi:hypothetical protein
MDLPTILTDCGLDTDTKQYLQARGIRNIAVMAMIAKDMADLENKVIRKYIDGMNIAGTEYKNAGDEDVVRATLMAAWRMAHHAHEQEFQAAVHANALPHLMSQSDCCCSPLKNARGAQSTWHESNSFEHRDQIVQLYTLADQVETQRNQEEAVMADARSLLELLIECTFVVLSMFLFLGSNIKIGNCYE